MPARGKIAVLPPEARKRLEARLIAQGFGAYAELAEWLSGEGYEISRSSLHRHGQALERRLAQIETSTRAAEALMARPDDKGTLAAATIKSAQSQLFEFMLALETEDPKEIAAAARAIADLARADVTVRRERKRALDDAERAADRAMKRQGLTGSTADAIREALRSA